MIRYHIAYFSTWTRYWENGSMLLSINLMFRPIHMPYSMQNSITMDDSVQIGDEEAWTR